ncbi:MAG: 6-phosphogluconolactonase [Burkholderiales bacterium]|nr:6-phosphogluconolactonase [Burkholderiales bacterium]
MGAVEPLQNLLARHGHLQVYRVAAAQLATELARDIAGRLQQAIHARGVAVLSVSGGKSPIALFEALRQQPLDWSKLHITLVDERYVPATHEASNTLLVRTHLLQGPAARARLHAMVPELNLPLPPLPTLVQNADADLHALGPADVMVLGVGADGHTASLFPAAPRLAAALDPRSPQACVGMALDPPPAAAPHARLTQTLAQILRSRHLILPVTGDDKLAALQQALREPTDRLPVSHLLHQQHTPLALWLTA